jgi:N-acetylglutamate synthase-like GNAT family acetyltransferase
MKLVRWKRFTWDLTQLPPIENPLPEQYIVRPATRDEAKPVSNLIFTVLTLDSVWLDTLNRFRDRLAALIEQSFARETAPALVVSHGSRIIAASVVSTDAAAESHLVTGPCVLGEYCNRGLGTALLHHTLTLLRTAGLESAAAITKENAAASKFVYPKFGSTSATYDPTLHLAGT